VISPIRNMVQA